MKSYKSFLLGVVVTVLVLSGFMAGNVYAITSCFSDIGSLPTVFQDAICWMKDNSITSGYPDGTYKPDGYVTRAQMALFMQNQSQVPPTTGLITITEGFGNWKPFTTEEPLSFSYLTGSTSVSRATTGSSYLSLHPSIPTVLYGKSLQLVGVEFCYSASASAYLSELRINVPIHTSGVGNENMQYIDGTDYTSPACHYYVLNSPVTMSIDNTVNVFTNITWTNTLSSFGFGRTTFVLQPTGTTAVAPSEISGDVIVLFPSDSQADTPSADVP